MKIKELIHEILVKHTGQTLERIRHDTERDYFMDAEEAMRYGIVDRIITEREMGKGLKA
jgi:ATP-dependent Clp protease protease subunit